MIKESDFLKELKTLYPNYKSVVVAAFGISEIYYSDDTYSVEVAKSLYTNIPKVGCFVGVHIKYKWTKTK